MNTPQTPEFVRYVSPWGLPDYFRADLGPGTYLSIDILDGKRWRLSLCTPHTFRELFVGGSLREARAALKRSDVIAQVTALTMAVAA